MADLNPYKMKVGRNEKNFLVVTINPAPENSDANWKLKYHGGHLFFGTKKDAKAYLDRKYKYVEEA